MFGGTRQAGAGRLTIHAMASLETFTMDPIGSPQLYQTGESYQVDAAWSTSSAPARFAHGARRDVSDPAARLAYLFGAHLIGEPALGPPAFMHRESARDNPQVPLTHHAIDSTHITPGVLTARRRDRSVHDRSLRVPRRGAGREPAANIEAPRLNSWSVAGRLAERSVAGAGVGRPAARARVVRALQPDAAFTASIGFNGDVKVAPPRRHARVGQGDRVQRLQQHRRLILVEWDLHATEKLALAGRVRS